MQHARNSFQKITACFLFLTLWLTACSFSPTTTPSPNPIATVAIKTPTATFTRLPLLTQTEKISLTPTPDPWEIQKCRKTSSIVSEDTTFIWNYSGDIEGHGRVDMLLNFTKDNEIWGFVFDFEKIQEYKVSGCVDERSFTMWLHNEDSVEAAIHGQFPETDPRQYYSSKSLTFDVITGSLIERSLSKSSAIYLRILSGGGGTMNHRFELEGVKDDTVILNGSQKFLAAISSNNAALVVETLHFPVECTVQGDLKKFDTPDTFMSYYNTIFGNGFKERLSITFPNYIIAYAGNFGGIALSVYGGGSIIFDADGKVIGIYNVEEETPTPITTNNGNK